MDGNTGSQYFDPDSDEDEAPMAVTLDTHGDPCPSAISTCEVSTHEESHKTKPVPATIITGCLGAGELILRQCFTYEVLS
jgi:hypothetical protein